MSKLFLAAVVLSLFAACSSREIPIRHYGQFIKEENCSWGETPSQLVDAMLYSSSSACGDSTERFFAYNGQIVKYNFLDSSYGLVAYANAVHNIVSASDAHVWFIEYRNCLIDALSGQALHFDSKIPLFDTSYSVVPYQELPVINNRIYTSIFTTDKGLHHSEPPRMPHIASWHLYDDTIVFDTLFGSFPKDYPYDNEGTSHLSKFIFNADDSLLVFYSGMMGTVVVYNLDGELIGERYIGSQRFRKLNKLSYEDFFDMSKFTEWGKNNTVYHKLVYDPYRKVYLRAMRLPAKTDKNAMEVDECQWILVVADRNFNIKYEVLFDNDSYRVASRIMPTPQGVYIEKIVDKNEVQTDLFVFD